MEFQLKRADVLQVGKTPRRAVHMLPTSKKKQQKAVVADGAGVLTSFGLKKGETQIVFQTPAESGPNAGITALALGGPTREGKDKIFVAAGPTIRGITKKGKEFFRFDSNLTESIQSLFVEGSEIWTGGDYVYNHFVDCKDTHYFMANDRINHVTCADLLDGPGYNGVLACQDRTIRVLRGEEVGVEIPVPGAPTSVLEYGQRQLVYGTENGHVGLLDLNGPSPLESWRFANSDRLGGVVCISAFDFTKDGLLDVLVGRDDGTVEILSQNVGPEPTVMFRKCVNESVTGIDAGSLSSATADDLLVSTYAGKVVAFTSEPTSAAEAADARKTVEGRVDKVRGELEDLQKQLAAVKRKMPDAGQSGASIGGASFDVNSKFLLNSDDGSYTLTVEIETSIDTVALHADVPVDLLDADNSAAIVSRTPADPENGSLLLATYRCQEASNRLEMRVRTMEGTVGVLTAYVIPRAHPKMCQAVQFPIRPLSLHQRIAKLSAEEQKRPVNDMTLSGSFSVPEVHSWVSFCVPEVPERVSEDEIKYVFRSTFLGTILTCEYRKGEAFFQSDSMSTISILKEVITREATNRKVRVHAEIELRDETIDHCLGLIDPKIRYQLSLTRKFNLLEALKEIKLQEDGTDFLSKELREVAEDPQRLEREYLLQPRRVEFLFGIVTDLFIDKYRFKGVDVRGKIPQLMALLEDYNLDALVGFFQDQE